jgi:peptidoglycan/xylan/chitin deacetylase (PgdA/CDA1 family)
MVMTIAERSVYSSILDRPRFSWPGDAGLAVWLAVNTEHYEFLAPSPGAWPRVPQPDVQGYASREFGNRVGFWRLADLLGDHGIPVTASLNLGLLEHRPEIRKALVERDWAIMSHGVFNTRNIIGLSADEERAFYDWSVKTVRNLTGRDLKGMLTPAISANYDTPDLMAEAGLTYHADWVNDDQPVPLRVAGGQKFVTVPYTFELNTGALFGRHFDAEYYLETAKQQFKVLLADARTAPRVMCLSVHPFAIGQPHAIGCLDELLGFMRAEAGVWWATGDDIAGYYLDHAYDAQVKYEQSLTDDEEVH